jgi:glycosyltransferase involved in cell wall biosynthesis
MRKLVIWSNTAWSLFNFRAGLIRTLVKEGYDVVVVAPFDEYAARLPSLGCRYVALSMDNKGINPVRDLILLIRFWLLLRRERPLAYLGYTVKPNVYGSLASNMLGIPVINNIAGLGVVFIKDSLLTEIVKVLYRLALSRSFKVFFQNDEDRQLFIQANMVAPEKTGRVPGSGVDLSQYVVSLGKIPELEFKPFRFLLGARMLWDKGIGQYVEAARLVKQRYPEVEFCLIGFLDVKNPAAISREKMTEWRDSGVIRYLGVTDDMKSVLGEVDCVVLPSYYREGVPRFLLEGAAMSKPIITTDSVGCREVVEDGVNGFLVRPRDVNDLTEKIIRMIELSPLERIAMGTAGRAKIEQEFDEKIVVDKYIKVIGLMQTTHPSSLVGVKSIIR